MIKSRIKFIIFILQTFLLVILTLFQALNVVQTKSLASDKFSVIYFSGLNKTYNPGQEVSLSIEIKNTGSAIWSNIQNYRLGINENDTSSEIGGKRFFLNTNDNISPNQTKVFDVKFNAPTIQGDYSIKLQMVKEFSYWLVGDLPALKFAVGSDTVTGSLSDLWEGKAHLKYSHKNTYDNPGAYQIGYNGDYGTVLQDGLGARTVVRPEGWYMFSRKILWGATTCIRKGVPADAIISIVRKSTDFGKTWSQPVVTVPSIALSNHSCAATDAGVWYDTTTDKWHMIFQCLPDGSGSDWKGCYASKDGSDPMGLFNIDPVVSIPTELLASKVCGDNKVVCTKNEIGSEGTFDIVDKIGDYFYVTYHATSYNSDGVCILFICVGKSDAEGFRGMARTKDFRTWESGSGYPGLPSEMILSSQDTNNFNIPFEQEKGGIGNSDHQKEDGYYYMLAEAAEFDLGCYPDRVNDDWLEQDWYQGLYRTDDISKSTYGSFPGSNPLIYNHKQAGVIPTDRCQLGYGDIIKDPYKNKNYILATRYRGENEGVLLDLNYSGTYFWEIVKDNNTLQNGDGQKCGINDWSASPGTNFVNYRNPWNSTDYNCHFALNCGTDCTSKYMLQTVDVGDLKTIKPNSLVKFGQKTKVTSTPNTSQILLREIDSNDVVIKDTIKTISQGLNYESTYFETQLLPNTSKIVYIYFVNTINQDTFVDEILLAPALGFAKFGAEPVYSTQIDLTVLLSGPYQNGKMSDNLLKNNRLPSSQPYFTPPWSYTGTETLSANLATAKNAVDWILVELIQSDDNQKVFTKAGILTQNGKVINSENEQMPNLVFKGLDLQKIYFVRIRHRNHISIFSTNALVNPQLEINNIDFTNNQTVKGGNQKQLEINKYGMYEGNANSDTSVDSSDRNQLMLNPESSSIYSRLDLNLDSVVDAADRNILRAQLEISEVLQ